MNLILKKEIPIIIIVILPFIYLAYIWNELPERVPMHWDFQGEIDRYGSKAELILIPIVLPLLIYALFLLIPKIDPKNKLKDIGRKYQSIKMALTALMSALAIFIIHSSKEQSIENSNLLISGLGVLFIILGNYFKTIKPNYFIGIKTPWTLENEAVWEATHNMAGRIWFAGGILVVLSSLVLNQQTTLILFLIITGIITIIPVVYSYLKYKKLIA